MGIVNRGFRNFCFFKKIRLGSDGFPVVGPCMILGKANETNNKALSLEDNSQDVSIEADNVVETEKTIVSKSGTLTVYDITPEAFASIFGYLPDDNGNIVDNPEGVRVDGVLFFETEKSDGTRMQHWFYDVTIYAPADAHNSFNGTNAAELEMAVDVRPLYLNNVKRFKATVYSGNTGFITSGLPTAIYKPTFSAAVATPVATPAAGAVASGTEIALSCATLGAVIYYTDDGSDPTEESDPYTVPIEITEGVTIKAKAFKAPKTASSVLSAAYTISGS